MGNQPSISKDAIWAEGEADANTLMKLTTIKQKSELVETQKHQFSESRGSAAASLVAKHHSKSTNQLDAGNKHAASLQKEARSQTTQQGSAKCDSNNKSADIVSASNEPNRQKQF